MAGRRCTSSRLCQPRAAPVVLALLSATALAMSAFAAGDGGAGSDAPLPSRSLSAYEALIACPHLRFNYKCPFGRKPFMEHLAALPPLSGDPHRVAVPEKTHVLFFGPSYLNEIFQSVLCFNRVIEAHGYPDVDQANTSRAARAQAAHGRHAISISDDERAAIETNGEFPESEVSTHQNWTEPRNLPRQLPNT